MFPSHPTTGSARTNGRDEYHQFVATRSRVIRLFNLPSDPSHVLASAFGPSSVHRPVSLWTLKDTDERTIWAVFDTHDEALAALNLSGNNVSIASASESFILSNIHCIKRVQFSARLASTPMDEQAAPFAYPYTLSSNPPNPRSQSTLFRQGDWLCPHAHCNVHNFSRNVACISCGSPRPPHVSQLPPTPAPPPHIPPFAHWQQQPQQQQQQQQAHSHQSSPRFTSPPISPTVQLSLAQQSPALAVVQQMAASAPKGQSLLTPSGRSFSVGGKVQNISNDPLSPCILFWPDNEPFPEQGQIRPPMTGGVQPPILNTGNKGPIEHQPGDWVCHTCEYHNWRRRKVCQTCFPFAEGNSDNVTAAAQQDRINLLASLLAQQHAAAQAVQASHTLAAAQLESPFAGQQQQHPHPPPPPPYQFPMALPNPSTNKSNQQHPGGLSINTLAAAAAGTVTGIPTPPFEPLELSHSNHNNASQSRAPSRLQRFASQPALRAHWPTAGASPTFAAHPSQTQTPSPYNSSPVMLPRAPLSASYAQLTHSISAFPQHQQRQLAPVNTRIASLGHMGANGGGAGTPPLSAQSDSFSLASASTSSSEYGPDGMPNVVYGRSNSVFVPNRAPGHLSGAVPRMFGSMATLPSQTSHATQEPTLDLEAFRLGMRLDDDRDDSEVSRPGTGSRSGGSGSISSVDLGTRNAWSRASIAGTPLTAWADAEDDQVLLMPRRGTAHVVAPIGSGRAGGSPPMAQSATMQNSASGPGSASGYVLVNIGK